MPSFTILRSGVFYSTEIASGNLKALLNSLKIKGVPDFPMYVHQGLLMASIGNANYTVYETGDEHAKSIVTAIYKNESKLSVKTVKLRLPELLSLKPNNFQELSYVV